MKIYILRAFPTAHKWYPDSWVIGHFTNKRALRKAIKKHAADLNIYNENDFWRALDCNDFWTVNTIAETGEVEIATANEF